MTQFPTLSANTLFHFTSKLENLLGILTNEFRPRFCLENYDCLAPLPHSDDEEYLWAVPMVCFCDLPLSQTAFHLSVYGDYGIGMTKSWGQRNGISPILYVYPGSSVTETFGQLLAVQASTKFKKQWDKGIYDFTCFIKPYEGNLWREGGELPNIRFYNEREWRFVPTLPDNLFSAGLDAAKFEKEKTRTAANRKLYDLSKISFEPNDIKYLIVRREDEIVPLIRDVESIKGKYSYDDVRLLASRVISAEQIRADF